MKTILIICAAVSAVFGALPDTSHLCDDVSNLDCAVNYVQNEADERVCGSDGVTYTNLCFYSQARCKTTMMHLASIGACGASVVVTTAATQPPVTTPAVTNPAVTTPVVTTPAMTTPVVTTMATTTVDHLLQVFCASKDTLSCNTDLDPICGSDKNFYLNKCEFSKATCDDPTMTIRDISWCTS